MPEPFWRVLRLVMLGLVSWLMGWFLKFVLIAIVLLLPRLNIWHGSALVLPRVDLRARWMPLKLAADGLPKAAMPSHSGFWLPFVNVCLTSGTVDVGRWVTALLGARPGAAHGLFKDMCV